MAGCSTYIKVRSASGVVIAAPDEIIESVSYNYINEHKELDFQVLNGKLSFIIPPSRTRAAQILIFPVGMYDGDEYIVLRSRERELGNFRVIDLIRQTKDLKEEKK